LQISAFTLWLRDLLGGVLAGAGSARNRRKAEAEAA
jgi:hypothetical protein